MNIVLMGPGAERAPRRPGVPATASQRVPDAPGGPAARRNVPAGPDAPYGGHPHGDLPYSGRTGAPYGGRGGQASTVTGAPNHRARAARRASRSAESGRGDDEAQAT
ncbi:hypothetical protein GCM10027187_50520 [Streptosporangium sandarakinum]